MSPIPGNTSSQGKIPSTLTIGTATSGNASASVAFTASSYIGKGTISYTATSSPGNITGTSASSPISITGLSNGTAYTFTVSGITNYGISSDSSGSSNSVTPVAPPPSFPPSFPPDFTPSFPPNFPCSGYYQSCSQYCTSDNGLQYCVLVDSCGNVVGCDD
jgi:hypothetical protein